MENLTTKQERSIAILANLIEKEPGEIQREHLLVSELGLDSTLAFELICDLEDEFEIEITPEAAAEFETVDDLLGAVESWD